MQGREIAPNGDVAWRVRVVITKFWRKHMFFQGVEEGSGLRLVKPVDFHGRDVFAAEAQIGL